MRFKVLIIGLLIKINIIWCQKLVSVSDNLKVNDLSQEAPINAFELFPFLYIKNVILN
jgi:hypothetical protein